MKKKKGIIPLKKKADTAFSIYIRNRDNGVCFTCGKKGTIKEMQNGHYESRRHNATRFDERNCHCQCVGCNVFKSGNMTIYALKLQELYGRGILTELRKQAQEIKKFTRNDLELIIEKYAYQN